MVVKANLNERHPPRAEVGGWTGPSSTALWADLPEMLGICEVSNTK